MSPPAGHPRNQAEAAAQPDAAGADKETCAESSRGEVGRCGCRSRRPGPGAGPARARGESRAGDPRCPTPPGPRSTPAVPCRSRSGQRPACRPFDQRGCSAIARASVDRFRVIHFSIQQDAARVHSFRGGITARRPRRSRRPRPCHRPGWRASAGVGRAGHCGWRNTRLPRRDPTRLDSADVAPTQTNTNSNTLWLTTSPTRARR